MTSCFKSLSSVTNIAHVLFVFFIDAINIGISDFVSPHIKFGPFSILRFNSSFRNSTPSPLSKSFRLSESSEFLMVKIISRSLPVSSIVKYSLSGSISLTIFLTIFIKS